MSKLGCSLIRHRSYTFQKEKDNWWRVHTEYVDNASQLLNKLNEPSICRFFWRFLYLLKELTHLTIKQGKSPVFSEFLRKSNGKSKLKRKGGASP